MNGCYISSAHRDVPLLNTAEKSVVHETIDLMERNLTLHEIPHKRLSYEDLNAEFPQLTFEPGHQGLVEYGAGVLFADKCLAALKVQSNSALCTLRYTYF